MLRALTHHERSQLSEELAALGRSCEISTLELCRASEATLGSSESGFGLQQRLARNVTRLQGFLRKQPDSGERSLAAGALQYVAQSDGANTPSFRSALLITDIALSMLDDPSGLHHGYSPWPLSPDLTEKAEALLIDFFEHPVLPDDDLNKTSERRREKLSWVGGSGFFGRFCRDLRFLEGVLVLPEFTDEQRNWARAALSYLRQEDDAVSDNFGLLGLCDDALMAGLAADLIDPSRQPWQQLFDRLHAEWSFLDRVIIHDHQGGQACSDFLLAMLSLVCPSLRNSDRPPRTALVVPQVASLPLLLATLATLGELEQYAKEEGLTPRRLNPGDTVRVDGSAYAHYEGITELNGEQYHTLRWEKNQIRRFLPLSQRFRLRLAKPRARASGRPNTTIAGTELPVSAIEYLLRIDESSVADAGLVTLLAAPVMKTEQQARALAVSGTRLRDTVPLASWTGERWREWSRRFLAVPPVTGITGDLLVAADLNDANPEARLLVADMSGVRGRETQAIRRISQSGTPILAVCDETDTESVDILRAHDFAFWEWTQRDLSEVISAAREPSGRGPVARCERAVRRNLTAEPPELHQVPGESSVQAFEHLRQLERLSGNGSHDTPRELSSAILKQQRVFFGLLRTQPDGADPEQVETALEELEREVDQAIYLHADEQQAIANSISAMRRMAEEIEDGAPRLRQLETLLRERRYTTVIARNRQVARRLTSLLEIDVRVLPSTEVNSLPPHQPVLVVGWHGRNRMLNLLVPPVSDSLGLLLYAVEAQWFELTRRFLEQGRTERLRWQERNSLFTIDSSWPEGSPRHDALHQHSTKKRLQQVTWHETDARRESALHGCRSQAAGHGAVRAHLVLFTEEHHAFLTPDRKVVRVTDTVAKDDAGAGLEEVCAIDLLEGDVIVLPNSADRDLLRERADEILDDGTRQDAALWRNALRRFCERESLDSRGLQKRLDEAGCSHHHLTISSWIGDEQRIGPRDLGDIDTVASLTRDENLLASLEACKLAVSEVRGAHLRAAHQLAEEVLSSLARQLAEGASSKMAEVNGDATILEVEHIDATVAEVPISMANRLLAL